MYVQNLDLKFELLPILFIFLWLVSSRASIIQTGNSTTPDRNPLLSLTTTYSHWPEEVLAQENEAKEEDEVGRLKNCMSNSGEKVVKPLTMLNC
jgi:hypothetical protein